MSYKEIEIFLDTSNNFLKEKRKLHPNTRMTRTASFNEIQETLEKFTGKAALMLMFRFGEISAETMLNNTMLSLRSKSFEKLLKKSIELGQEYNWYKIESYKIGKKTTKLIVYSTFESALHKKVDYPVCSFVKGYLNKIANSSKEGYICKCDETKCIAKGDEYCEFEIKKTK